MAVAPSWVRCVYRSAQKKSGNVTAYYTLIFLPEDVKCNIAIYANDNTLYFKCDQASDLWQQLEWASELESDLQDIVDWGRNWIGDFSAGKTQLVLVDQSNNVLLVLLM